MARRKKGRKVALVAGCALVVLAVVMVGKYWEEIRSWYALRRAFESLGKNAQGYPEYRHRQTRILFVGLPGGEFEREDGLREEMPPFLIGKYELGKAAWQEVMSDAEEDDGKNLPASGVSWDECKVFCSRTGLRMPTEAQWEYACLGGNHRLSTKGSPLQLRDLAWCDTDEMRLEPFPRGLKRPNACGLYDMQGNLAEWCEDVFSERVFWDGQRRVTERVIRGGWRLSELEECDCRVREGASPGAGGWKLGFRPAYYRLPGEL